MASNHSRHVKLNIAPNCNHHSHRHTLCGRDLRRSRAIRDVTDDKLPPWLIVFEVDWHTVTWQRRIARAAIRKGLACRQWGVAALEDGLDRRADRGRAETL